MGVDLRLLPFDCDQSDFIYSQTVLSCNRFWVLFHEIEKLPSHEIVGEFRSFCGRIPDSAYDPTKETPYGTKLRYTTVQDLLSIDRYLVNDSYVNKAIWAYLAEVP